MTLLKPEHFIMSLFSRLPVEPLDDTIADLIRNETGDRPTTRENSKG